MAQTKIWDSNSAYKTLWYIMNEKKTRSEENPLLRYVTRLHCFGEAKHIAQQFSDTKARYHKPEGIQVYHAEQSFLPGEVTPELAHQVGVEMAKELWGDRFEVVVATHLDKEHIHTHFCLNSVSFKDGYKFHDCLDFYAHMREVSDRICKEHGLSVIQNPGRDRKKYKTWQREQEGQESSTVRDWIREDIDKLLPEVGSIPELFSRLSEMGYTVDTSGKYIKMKPKGKDRYFRLYKLGKGYTEENLYDRIQENRVAEYKAPVHKQIRYSSFTYCRIKTLGYLKKRQRYRPGSLMAIYLSYRHLLKKYTQGRVPTPQPSLTLREDARDLQRFSEKTYLLCANSIHSEQELLFHREGLGIQAKDLTKERQSLRNRLAKTADPIDQEAMRKGIAALTASIRQLAKEEKLCDEILQEAQQVKGKEWSEREQLESEQEKSTEQEREEQNV